MDIATLSMALSRSNLATAVTTAVASKAMDAQQVQMDGLVEMMRAASPAFGQRMDIRA